MNITLLEDKLVALKELDKLIVKKEQNTPKHTGIFSKIKNKKYQKELNDLYTEWEAIAQTRYPMIINAKGNATALGSYSKEIRAEIKKIMKELMQMKEKPVYVPPTLDDIIKRNEDNNKLINDVLYSRIIVSDQPDPMRKRKK